MEPAQPIENQLRAESTARFPSLHLPAEWVTPDYGGRSIVNVAATVARRFRQSTSSRWALVWFDKSTTTQYTKISLQRPSGSSATTMSCYGSFNRA